MPNNLFKGLAVLSLIILFAGCETANQVQMRGYQQDKKRVDQQLGGALGNWQNSSQVVDEDRKKTRKIYVLEFTQNPEPADYNIEEIETETSRYIAPSNSYEEKTVTTRRRVQETPRINLPSFDEEEEWIQDEDFDGPRKAVTYVEYTVEKNDTLQKISKKFYDSYSKWPRIYDANKQKIKNPNAIKEGLVIKVPVE